jgi:vancomycin resistance protein YoaR
MSKKKPSFLKSKLLITATIITLLPMLLIISILAMLMLSQRIYPGISISGVDVSLLTRDQAFQKVSKIVSERGSSTLTFELNNASLSAKQNFSINLSKQETASAINKAVGDAFTYGRSKPYFAPVTIFALFEPSLPIKKQVENIAISVNQPAIDSNLKILEGEITVTPSQNGTILDEYNMYSILNDYLNGKSLSNMNVPLKTQEPELTFAEATSIKKRLDQIKDSPLKLSFEYQIYTLDLNTVLSLIDLENSRDSLALLSSEGKSYNIGSVSIDGQEISESKLTLSREKLLSYLKNIALEIDRPAQEPLFSVDPSSSPDKPKITEFRPPVEGRQLKIDKAADLITSALITENKSNLELPVEIIEPKNKLTNELGIKELVGSGTSSFAGSIENRRYNIGLAASKINGVLIPPGEEFSFVNTVGDISAATGFKQAYVIKSGRTVLDDGGGVCQVSTTIFRAALNTGLPITARTAHAYRVGYYEQGFPPGLDATIFHPSVDFKFKNDTDKHILIQAYVSGNSLTVDLYGTSDGRTVAMTKPIVTGVTPAPPEIRQDDPTLPRGTVKQVDWAANGANVSFSRTVTKGGITYINEVFRSNYRPWQAVFLVGTKDG